MRRLVAAVAVAPLLAAPLVVAVPSPASAMSRDLKHHSPDDGYHASIIATCSWANRATQSRYIAVGRSAGCATQGVYLRAGEELWCRETPVWGWRRRFAGKGWHAETYWGSDGCTLRKP